jgi:hypothetical protein
MTVIVRGATSEDVGKATGQNAHAEGNSATSGVASGNQAHAEGFSTIASGAQSHAEGSSTTASGAQAHAEGNGSASGAQSHAEGNAAVASATASHAEGNQCTANATNSHAEGSSTTASGLNSHAEGQSCQASGTAAHAEGAYAIASRLGQHAKASWFIQATGDAQYSNYTQMALTTNATPMLMVNGPYASGYLNSGGNISVLTLPASRAFSFRFDAIARRTDVAGECAAFTITGAVVSDASGAPRLVGTPATVTWADAAAAAWTIAVSIVNPSGSIYYLAFTATGEAGKTIRWCATLHTTEVG